MLLGLGVRLVGASGSRVSGVWGLVFLGWLVRLRVKGFGLQIDGGLLAILAKLLEPESPEA